MENETNKRLEYKDPKISIPFIFKGLTIFFNSYASD